MSDLESTLAHFGHQFEADGIAYLLIQFVDIHGAAKVKLVPASDLASCRQNRRGVRRRGRLGHGAGPSLARPSARPDLNTYTPLPYEPGVARFAADLYVDGEPHPYCPRVNLNRMLAGPATRLRLQRRHRARVLPGRQERRRLDSRAGTRTASTTWPSPATTYKGISRRLGFLRAMNDGLDRLGWGVYQSDHEDANFQYEINFQLRRRPDHGRPLDLLPDDGRPDRPASRRDRDLHGQAVLRPAPARARTCTIIWPMPRPGRTCFSTSPTPAASASRRSLTTSSAGSSQHAPALCAVTSPTVNCYKRLQVGAALTGSRSGYTWTPAFITYGDNNRTQMLRVPEGGHVEDRSISSACNPYLAIAAYLAAGPRRHRPRARSRRAEPGKPLRGRPRDHGRSRRRTLPQTPAEALDHFEPTPSSAKAWARSPTSSSAQARRMAGVSRARSSLGNQTLPDGALSGAVRSSPEQ